ncbi:MAG: malto-oligosyltrehalose trehalohydrolase [Actinomycetaceae bacterium]|nr:malto-oligosyltrehalose trehalohydrolase [Actinomycetaceae bacterium]
MSTCEGFRPEGGNGSKVDLDATGWHCFPPGRGQVAVWSRSASHVEVVTAHATYPMHRDGGWWRCETALPDGVDYFFAVDGKQVPDPRGLYRPQGVHGPARTWTPPSLQHPDLGSTLGKVFYELHVGTFTPEGTFAAAAKKLPYLRDLGVQVVEVMPVAAFPGDFGWGYDGVGIYATQACYGGPQQFVDFIRAAHDLGIQVCLDLVLNHLGPVGNYIALLDDYYSDSHTTPWGPAFDLDGANASHTRDFLIGAALHFLGDMGCDALRLDAVHALVDDSNYHLLAELSDTVSLLQNQVGRTLTLIAESDLNDPIMVTPTAQGGRGMDGQWDDDLHHALHATFTGESHGYYGDFAARGALTKAFEDVFVHDGGYSSFRGKNWGVPVTPGEDRRRFLIFSQNHDQVGNRAIGDRPSRKLSSAQLAAQAALTLLSPFTPLLFQGQEWGSEQPFLFFSDQQGDEAMAAAMREGREREFADHGWDAIYGQRVEVPDPTSADTFEFSKLDWAQLDSGEAKKLWHWHRMLTRLRSNYQEYFDGSGVHLTWTGDLLSMSASKPVPVVVVNFGSVPLPVSGEVLYSWEDFTAGDTPPACPQGAGSFLLSPGSVAILRP